MPVLSAKETGPQVLPTLVDDDFLPIGKDVGEPLVLPGVDDVSPALAKGSGEALVLPGIDDAGGWDFMVVSNDPAWNRHSDHSPLVTPTLADQLLGG
jgi:hypothetical protein